MKGRFLSLRLMTWRNSLRGISLLVVAAMAGSAVAGTIVDDYSGGVVVENHPDPADGGTASYGTYYDITNDAFGTPSDGGGFLRVDDGGFTNGVYAIYEAIIPADGTYTLSADVNFEATATSGATVYEIGAVVNGVHRGANPSDLAILNPADAGTGVGDTSWTAGVDPPSTLVTTGSFVASAGDDLLVAFGTNLQGPDFDANSGFWRDSFVTIDNVMLNLVPEPSTALPGLMSLLICLGFARRR